jgi:hypothetical protein
MVVLDGCVVTAGKAFTVNVALLLVADGAQVPLTTHRYWLLLIDTVTPVKVSVEVVAPEYTPALERLLNPLPAFSCHW